MEKQKIKAFTLVELIIVITILAILATIGFMSFQSYTIDARDSNRVTSLREIAKWLDIYQTKNRILPYPDEKIAKIWSWAISITDILSYQWYIWNEIQKNIKLTYISKDPKDNSSYTYSINWIKTKYQLLALLEDWKSYNLSYKNILKDVYASNDYINRKTYTIWNMIWIFLSWTTNLPVQETLTWINLNTDTNSYKVLFSNNSNSWEIFSSWNTLYQNIIEKNIPTENNWNSELTYSWSWDSSNWFILKDSNNTNYYPKSCNNLILSSTTNFKIWTTTPYNWSSFIDGMYYIKYDSNPAIKVYCDMITDWWWWTLVANVLSWATNNIVSSPFSYVYWNIDNLNNTYLLWHSDNLLYSWASYLIKRSNSISDYCNIKRINTPKYTSWTNYWHTSWADLIQNSTIVNISKISWCTTNTNTQAIPNMVIILFADTHWYNNTYWKTPAFSMQIIWASASPWAAWWFSIWTLWFISWWPQQSQTYWERLWTWRWDYWYIKNQLYIK